MSRYTVGISSRHASTPRRRVYFGPFNNNPKKWGEPNRYLTACGLPHPASGRRSRPSVALHVCFLTGAPRGRRPGRCPPFHAPIPPATSTDCPAAFDGRGEAVIFRLVVRCASPVAPPPSRPRQRSNSDHAGKITYWGKIESLDRDPGIATLVPGMRFPGN